MKKPFKIYAEVLEDEALRQFEEAMSQPFVVSGALMPDAHVGYSLPIGGVVAADNYVVPSYVGFDKGCGVLAATVENISPDDIKHRQKDIFDAIYRNVPVGFNINKTEVDYSTNGLTEVGKSIAESKHYRRALGSLGSGNHFIEVGVDEQNTVWIIIHSGSRGVGHGIATHYIKQAHPDGKCQDGHYGFEANSTEGQHYIQDLNWCLDYALANRMEMLNRTADAITQTLGLPTIMFDQKQVINRHHNHAVNKDGLWIHRKGATHAELDMMGVIPGNMRDGSFIVKGKGNPESLFSSSHGAGRVMGRKEAKRQLELSKFTETMNGVQANVKESTLDESPFAYKDIFEVMRLQADLVETVAYVKPLINIKG